jgi:hypothetical protein
MGMSQKLERHRFRLLRNILQRLDLQPPENIPRPPLSPLPQFLVTSPHDQPQPQNPFRHLQTGLVSGRQDDFEFRSLSCVDELDWAVIRSAVARREPDTKQRRTWVICPEELPHQNNTPLFNLANYFDFLANARGSELPDNLVGNNVLYGEAVTSTQTQLTL